MNSLRSVRDVVQVTGKEIIFKSRSLVFSADCLFILMFN